MRESFDNAAKTDGTGETPDKVIQRDTTLALMLTALPRTI